MVFPPFSAPFEKAGNAIKINIKAIRIAPENILYIPAVLKQPIRVLMFFIFASSRPDGIFKADIFINSPLQVTA
jgi:hypothetical protein